MNSIKVDSADTPLAPFVWWRARAPYVAHMSDGPDSPVRKVQVLHVESETGFARHGHGRSYLVHRVHSMAVAHYDGKQHLAARWLCGRKRGTDQVVEVANSEDNELCPACEDVARGPGTYRLFDRDGVLLYLGASRRIAGRLQSHGRTKPWWPDVADVRVERFATLAATLAAEKLAIKAEAPLYNKMHKVGYRRAA